LRLCDLVSRMNKTVAVTPLSLIETLLAVIYYVVNGTMARDHGAR